MGERAEKVSCRTDARSNTRSLLTRRTARIPAARNRYALLREGRPKLAVSDRSQHDPREEPAIFPSKTSGLTPSSSAHTHTHTEKAQRKKQTGRQTALVKKE